MKDLQDLRNKIDELDDKIVKLLVERFSLSKEVSDIKIKENKPVFDKKREDEILNGISKKVESEYSDYVVDVYRSMLFNSKRLQSLNILRSKKFYLLGEKLSHSFSKEIHVDRGYNYSLKEIEKEKLEDFIRNFDYGGLNVTIPYKKEVIKFVDKLSDIALNCKNVNTIVKKDGIIYGENTDFYGLTYSLIHFGVSLENKCVCVLGNGGVSSTVQYLCKTFKVKKLTVVSRSGDINYSNYFNFVGDVDILFNTTPVGTYPNVNESLVDLTYFKNLSFVFDLTYNPLKTKLLLDADKLKIKNGNGLYMLVAQALYSESVWSGIPFNLSDCDYTYKKLLKDKINVVLIGMPGSGKSTLAKIMGKKLNKRVLDTDRLIEEKVKCSCKDYIEKYGEKRFRAKESEIIKDISLSNGVIISVGGGGVLIEENVENLKRNGVLIYVKRDLSLLSKKNRPISKGKGIENLYLERKDIYERVSDFSIDNDGDLENSEGELIKIYENFGD